MQQPRSRQRPSWASQDDYAGFNFVVILVGSAFFGYLLWLYHHATISAGVMGVIHQEIRLIDLFSNRYQIADQEMSESPPSGVTFKDLYGITQAVGMFFRVPAAAIIVLLAIVCAVRAAPSRFKRQFDMDGLIREQARGFPVISAFANRHLQLRPPAPKGQVRPADYALTPSEWIAAEAIDRLGKFSEARARAALAVQLGDRWNGQTTAASAPRLLFVIFMLHLAEKRELALRLLGDASTCLSSAKNDEIDGPVASLQLSPALIGEIDALMLKQPNAIKDPAVEIAGRHAFVTTALMSLLTAARIKAGVLAPAQFVWLKLVDRNLWYALHSLGYEIEGVGRYIHPNPRVEALGARNHWAAERITGRAILKPELDEALASLRRFQATRDAEGNF